MAEATEAPEAWFPGDGSRTEHYDYPLPEGRVARYPADRRDRTRLLVAGRPDGEISYRRFRDLGQLLSPGDRRRYQTVHADPEREGSVWAVGTTSTRVLVTVASEDGRYRPGRGETDLFIHPPHRFRGVDRLIANFYLPRSSLLLLVSAFAGREFTERVYRHAVDGAYCFYSYADACLFL